ncbi:MAG TPA: hypothetical protein PK413_16725, partial [Thermoanaerobaculia bacterium]|nr:hypothetical protein [Thermoanaerobaculia bacterium]
MRPNRHLWLPAFALAACFAARPAHPVCDQTGASTADRDTFAVHGCDVAFFRFSAVAYDQRQGDWQDRGWLDACNLNLEFTKHWNATFLVTFGLADDLLHSWHGTVDYRATAEATNALYHVDIFHTADDDPCCFGSFKPHTFGRDEVSTHCALYDAGATNGNPGSRAGDFMHEGWHAWQRRYHFTGGPMHPMLVERLPWPVVGALGHGWLGVQVFFVLSGFVIAYAIGERAMTPRGVGRAGRGGTEKHAS